MPRSPIDLSADEIEFLTTRHLATLTTLRPTGRPTWLPSRSFDPHDGIVRVITSARSQKARNVERSGRAAVCQVDGPVGSPSRARRWSPPTPSGWRVAVAGFERRYRPARDNPDRAAIEITVERVLGRA
jgi:F420H(2)-dependent biliverdin reductase